MLLIAYEAGVDREVLFGIFGGLAILFIGSNSVVTKLAPVQASESDESDPEGALTQTTPVNEQQRLWKLTLVEMLKSKEFIALAAFGCVHVLHSNTYLGFVGDALLHETSQRRVDTLIRMFRYQS